MDPNGILPSKQKSTRYYLVLVMLIISLAIASSFFGFSWRTDGMLRHQLLEEARAFRQEVLLLRKWVKLHGGIYIRAEPGYEPKPDTQRAFGRKQFIRDGDGQLYLLRNSSEVTKELSDLSRAEGIVSFRTISFTPIHPEDLPDNFETGALRQLQQGNTDEVYGLAEQENKQESGKAVFRYLYSFHTDDSCLACHQEYGYRAGKIDGALSIQVPATHYLSERITNRWLIIGSALLVIVLVIFTVALVAYRFMRELKRADEQLQRLASEDPLTGLYNRRIGMEWLQQGLARSLRSHRPLSLMMIDIDHFKQVNDNYGHLNGDRVLVELAALIKASVRQYDFAVRYGGEEFLIVLEDCALETAQLLAERLRQMAEAHRIVIDSETTITFTLSIGVAELAGEAMDQLIGRADNALYQAKRTGRNRVVLAG